MNIELGTLILTRYNELKHKVLREEFMGESSSEFIHQIVERLELSKNNDTSIFKSAFVVENEGIPIGYLFISSMINDEVFLEYAILKKYRRMGYGSSIVNEVSEYLFENHNIKSVRLDIDPSNNNSIMLADSCGFIFDEEEYESRNYLGKMQFVKENSYYISKRRK